MAKPQRPPEQTKNSYEDDDMVAIIGEIEGFEAEKRAVRASAAGTCAGISEKIKKTKKRAKELGIPLKILDTLLAQRKLERDLEKLNADIPDELTELWLEASGQFSFIAPDGEEPPEPDSTPASRAAAARAKQAQENQQREQEEGDRLMREAMN